MKISKVAIVGGGFSGLICGSVLEKNGIKVTIFDKGRIAGGRIASRDRDANIFDYGAQFFTASDKRFRQFLLPLVRNGKVARWNGRFANTADGNLVAEKLTKPRYVGVPLMRTLAETLATELDCRTSHRITQVCRLNETWRLEGNFENEGKSHSFSSDGYEFVVFSLPPEQAAVLCQHPRLAQVNLMPCCALLLSFQQRVEIDFDGIKLDDAVISWLGRDSSKPGRSIGERWVIHGSPTWSTEYFAREEDEIKNLLIERFATICDIKLPAISFAKLHKWKFALPISPPAWGCIVDRQLAVAYCGDWCMSARIEGAFLSGLSAADEILKIKNLPG